MTLAAAAATVICFFCCRIVDLLLLLPGNYCCCHCCWHLLLWTFVVIKCYCSCWAIVFGVIGKTCCYYCLCSAKIYVPVYPSLPHLPHITVTLCAERSKRAQCECFVVSTCVCACVHMCVCVCHLQVCNPCTFCLFFFFLFSPMCNIQLACIAWQLAVLNLLILYFFIF